jgi:hypothetical protein
MPTYEAKFIADLPHCHLSRLRQATKCYATASDGIVGGHTAEMMRLVAQLDFDRYTPRTYLVSSGDHLSVGKARELELRSGSEVRCRNAGPRC